MTEERQQYRPCSPTLEFWSALLHVRNYLFEDPVFAHFVCTHYQHRHQIATDFWVVDTWLGKVVLELEEAKTGI